MTSGLPTSGDIARLKQLLQGFQVTQALHVAALLGLPDLVAVSGSRDLRSLAEESGVEPAILSRLMRVLTGVGVFSEISPARFRVTLMGELLRPNAQHSLHGRAVLFGQDWIWRPWGELIRSIRDGTNAFDELFGMPFFDFLENEAEACDIFDAALATGSRRRVELTSLYDFSDVRTLVDVGGGGGTLLAGILEQRPDIQGKLIDRRRVLVQAEANMRRAKVLDRCELVDADFFEWVPPEADIYIMSQVLHDWDDESAVTILNVCRRSMRADSKLLIIERDGIMGSGSMQSSLSDLNVLVLLGGQERSVGDYERVLRIAKLEMQHVLHLRGGWIVLEVIVSRSL